MSHTLSYPQIILFGNLFSTSLISYMVTGSKTMQSFCTRLSPPHCHPNSCPAQFALRWYVDLHFYRVLHNNLWKDPISRWHFIHHTWPLYLSLKNVKRQCILPSDTGNLWAPFYKFMLYLKKIRKTSDCTKCFIIHCIILYRIHQTLAKTTNYLKVYSWWQSSEKSLSQTFLSSLN